MSHALRFRSIYALLRYAIAVVMLKQLTFKQTQQYKLIVIEVAVTASTENRSTLLGVFYDEVLRYFSCIMRIILSDYLYMSFHCRQEAADVAGKLGSNFKAAEFFEVLNEPVLRRAKQQYDNFKKELVVVLPVEFQIPHA